MVFLQKNTFDPFHSEWKTFGQNRVFIKHRDAFPDENDYQLLTKLSNSLLEPSARIIHLYVDDKHCINHVYILTTKEFNSLLLTEFTDNVQLHIKVVPESVSKHSDHYNHTTYLVKYFHEKSLI